MDYIKHYERNPHPEFYNNGINGMSLVDFIEMVCDWKAAVRRHKTGNIYNSIAIGKNRFNLSAQVEDLILNSVK